VAQLKSRIVATAGLVNINNSQAKIVRMSVAKECRRQGIARNLLEYVIKLALESSLGQLLVTTEHSWDAAINLYREAGFIAFDRDLIDVHMRLDLQGHTSR